MKKTNGAKTVPRIKYGIWAIISHSDSRWRRYGVFKVTKKSKAPALTMPPEVDEALRLLNRRFGQMPKDITFTYPEVFSPTDFQDLMIVEFYRGQKRSGPKAHSSTKERFPDFQ